MRICDDDYTPTFDDKIYIQTEFSGFSQIPFNMKKRELNIFKIKCDDDYYKRWIPQIDNVISFVITLNVSVYDEINEDTSKNRLEESMELYSKICNCEKYKDIPIMFILTNVEEFKNKIETSDFTNYFPAYTGGSDFNQVLKYIIGKFMELNDIKRNYYPYIIYGMNDNCLIPLLKAMTIVTYLNNELKISEE